MRLFFNRVHCPPLSVTQLPEPLVPADHEPPTVTSESGPSALSWTVTSTSACQRLRGCSMRDASRSPTCMTVATGAASVVKLHVVPWVVPKLLTSSIRQKYSVSCSSVPGSKLVDPWLTGAPKLLLVPKYTSWEVAWESPVQVSVVSIPTPEAPSPGVGPPAGPGGSPAGAAPVVKLQVIPGVVPSALTSSTRQK